MPSEVKFYRVRDPYGGFSNFAPRSIVIDGKWWYHSEGYYQAQKFAGTPHEEAIRTLKSPREAADYGRRTDLPLREDWEQVKDTVMLEALRAKFTQHADLRAMLLSTGDAALIEHTRNDNYWGDGGDGSGQNKLGRLLMQLRSELHEAS